MPFAPYQWRAGEGYLPPPNSIPYPLCPQPTMYPGAYGGAYYGAAPYGWPAGSGWPAGPVAAVPPPPPPAPPAAPPAPPKKEDDVHSVTSMAPPTMAPGVNYMFSSAHTKLHIFNKAAKVWEEKYKSQPLAFKIFKVSTNFSVADVIERVLKKKPEGDEAKTWAVTEVVEGGEGEWRKGSTIEYSSDKAKGTLGSMGWNEKRGEGMPPVWLVVHKL